MKTVRISARPRMLTGTGVAKKIRRAGLVPAVVYGHDVSNNLHVALDPRPLAKALSSAYGRNQLIELEVEGATHLAMCRQVEVHPVSRQLRHIDFYTLTPQTKIEATLPIEFLGRSAGQKAGGRLEIAARFVKVVTTPEHLPASIQINLEPFENGQSLAVESLPYPAGVTPTFRQSFKVFELIAPKIVKVEAPDPKAKKKK